MKSGKKNNKDPKKNKSNPWHTILFNERGISAIAVAMGVVFLVGIGASLMMNDLNSTSRIGIQMRLALQAYSIMDQLATRFRAAYELRNPPWFINPGASCPLTPPGIINQGAAPGGRYCSYPAQACPLGTSLVTVGTLGVDGFEICLADDIDSNVASANNCIRSPTGADYCLDLTSLITRNESDTHHRTIPTLEIPLIEKTPWGQKFKNQAVALYEHSIQTVAPYLDPLEQAQAQGVQNFLSARPNKPALGATSNTVTFPNCPNLLNNAATPYCVRCADTDVSCIQIKLCMPPGCAAGGQALYQRIAILRSRP